jgi:hypothetical protein
VVSGGIVRIAYMFCSAVFICALGTAASDSSRAMQQQVSLSCCVALRTISSRIEQALVVSDSCAASLLLVFESMHMFGPSASLHTTWGASSSLLCAKGGPSILPSFCQQVDRRQLPLHHTCTALAVRVLLVPFASLPFTDGQ